MSEGNFQIEPSDPALVAEIRRREQAQVTDLQGGLDIGLNLVPVGKLDVPGVHQLQTQIAPAACFAASVASCLGSGEIGVKVIEMNLLRELKARGLMHMLGVTSPTEEKLREINDVLFALRDNAQFVDSPGNKPNYVEFGKKIVSAVVAGNPVIMLYGDDVTAQHQSWGVLMGVDRGKDVEESSWRLRQTARARTVSLTTPELAKQIVGTGNTDGARALILNRNMFTIGS